MKTFITIHLGLAVMVLLAGRSFGDAAKPVPGRAAAPVVPPRSVFTMPTNPHEGRDPFFPESTRVSDSMRAASQASETTTVLTVKGFSIVGGRPMVIINNHSFMAGDEGDVLSNGNRAHVKCLEIRPGTVLVEVNGAHHEIHF